MTQLRHASQTVNGQSRSHAYSFRPQMVSLTDTNSAAFSYDFDGDGNRIKQSGSGCLTARFVYDGPNVVLDLNASNEVVHAYVNGLGIDQPIERIDFVASQARVRYVYHTDGLGSVVGMTGSEQQTARSYSYEAFGKIRSETGALVINRYTFTGREALGDSLGLYYYRWRVMDPNVGRFTSEDPLGFVDDFSLYRYLSNSPLSGTDPRGQVGPIVRRIIFRPIPLGGPYIPISCTLIYTLDTVSRRYCHWDCIDGHWSDMVGDRVSRVTETCPNASCPHPTS
jgi:RHS repeat-associated protein